MTTVLLKHHARPEYLMAGDAFSFTKSLTAALRFPSERAAKDYLRALDKEVRDQLTVQVVK